MSIRYPVLGFETAIFWNESPPVTTRQGSHNQCGVCMYLIAKRVDMIERVNKSKEKQAYALALILLLNPGELKTDSDSTKAS